MSAQLAYILILLYVCIRASNTSVRRDDVAYVILSQQYSYKTRLKDELSKVSNHVYSKNELDHPGHWTLLPILPSLWQEIGKDVNWFFFCTEDTSVNVDKLLDYLDKYEDVKNDELFIGHAVYDQEPTIIHHFELDLTFKYPLFSCGFLISRQLMKRLQSRVKKSQVQKEQSTDFSIDSSYEFAQFVWNGGKGVALTDEADVFCVRKHEDCLTYVHIDNVCEPLLDVQDVYFAVKTYEKFHNDRLKILKSTWGAKASVISYFSNVKDKKFPTVKLNAPNSPTGHCVKTAEILKRVSKYIEKNTNIKWVMITDDDTILSVRRVLEIANCYRSHDNSMAIGERYGYNVLSNKGYNYLTGGAGVLLTTTAVTQLAHSPECKCSSLSTPDDMYLFGVCLQKLNISLVHSSLFHQARPVDYSHGYLSIGHPVTFHKHWMIDPVNVYNKWFKKLDENKPSHVEL